MKKLISFMNKNWKITIIFIATIFGIICLSFIFRKNKKKAIEEINKLVKENDEKIEKIKEETKNDEKKADSIVNRANDRVKGNRTRKKSD
jgi:predicted tellurium resistance membrane protein TerC